MEILSILLTTQVFIIYFSIFMYHSEAQINKRQVQQSKDGFGFTFGIPSSPFIEQNSTGSLLYDAFKKQHSLPENPFTQQFLNMNKKPTGNPFTDSIFGVVNEKENGRNKDQGESKRHIRKEEDAEKDSDHNEDSCELSITTVRGRKVCKNVEIFSDEFAKLDEDVWTTESYIPSYSRILETTFYFFDKDSVTCNGDKLKFSPRIMNETFVRRGTLELKGCTSDSAGECETKSHWMLPPIASGRVTTRKSFSFKYGVIEIHAKVPEGDWLIPEMWLVPKNEKYGSGLESGRIVIAMVRGNRVLEHEGKDLGYKTIESSLIMSSGGKDRYRALRAFSETPWPFQYNKYKFVWRPDSFTFYINGVAAGNLLDKTFTGTLANLVGFSHHEAKKWFEGSAVAPFDQEFYISLGLSVGGRDFPDDSVSGTYAKPWRSKTVKASVNFWKAKENWEKTWKDPQFKIVSIKVKSL